MRKTVLIFLFALGFAASAAAQNLDKPTDTNTDVQSMTTPNICSNVCFERISGGLFTCNQLCPFSGDFRLPAGLEFLTRNVRVKLMPPMLKDIEFDPAPPKPGGTAAARMIPVTNVLDEQTQIAAKFIYAFDKPDDWAAAVPALEPAKGYWETTFDVPAGAKKLYAMARLGDQFDNTYITIPCDVEGDPWKTDTCYFPLVADENYEDIKRPDINPSLDILNLTFGMDRRKYYFRLTARDKIDPGRLSPPQTNYYLISVYAPGRAPEVDPFNKNAFIFYAPYLENSSDCKILLRRGPRWTMDTSGIKCTVKDNNTIQFEIARKIIDTTISGEFVVYAATGMLFDQDTGIVADYTSTAAVRVDKGPIDLTK
jgi:hypothetical protein